MLGKEMLVTQFGYNVWANERILNQAAKVDEELEDISIRVVKALGLEYAGIDIAESPRGYVVFEANAAPLWRGLMNATGVNPAKAIAKHVLGLIKR